MKIDHFKNESLSFPLLRVRQSLFRKKGLHVPVLMCCVMLLFSSLLSNAQSQGDVFLQSPNAASLGIYGKLDVNLFSGLANVNLPVFNLKHRDLTISASLQYNSGGVLVEQHPSWVGQNWSLNVGGVITRKINGAVDEVYVEGLTDVNQYAYYYNFNKLAASNWDQTGYMSTMLAGMAPKLTPDEFLFTLPNGKSGTVLLDHAGIWQIKSSEAKTMKVSVWLNSQTLLLKNPLDSVNYVQPIRRAIYGFNITDDDGTVYTFGNNINSIEFFRNARPTYGFSNARDEVISNSWYLTKITSVHGNVINFEYERGTHQFIQTASLWYTSSHFIKKNNIDVCDGNSFSNPAYSGYVITPSYLKKITSESFVVSFKKEESIEMKYPYNLSVTPQGGHAFNNFNYADFIKGHYHDVGTNGTHLLMSNPHRDYKLTQILIDDRYGNPVERYAFTYNNDIDLPTAQRLFLKRFAKVTPLMLIDEIDPSPDIIHEFTYEAEDLMPGYNTLKVDESGYFNNLDIALLNSGIKFTANLNFARRGSLKSIKYPTGGRTNFYYGLNDFSQRVRKTHAEITLETQVGSGGGLRVDSMEHLPLIGPRTITKYVYKHNNGNSSGISAGKVSNSNLFRINSANNALRSEAYIVSSNSLDQLNYTHGRPVVYSVVQEVIDDISKNIYTYSNWDNVMYRDKPIGNFFSKIVFVLYINGARISEDHTPSATNQFPLVDYSSLDFVRGKLLKLERYSGSVLRYRKTNAFSIDSVDLGQYIRSYVYPASTIDCGNGTFVQESFIMPKKIYSFVLREGGTTEEYFNKLGIPETQLSSEYTYTSKALLKSEEHHESNGSNRKTVYTYTDELPSGSVKTGLEQRNMLSSILRKDVKVDGTTIEYENFTYGPVSASNGYAVTSLERGKAGSAVQRVSYSYGNYGNLVGEQSDSHSPPISYLWSYSGQYPILKVINLSYQNLTSYLTNAKVQSLLATPPTPVQLSSLRDSLSQAFPNALITALSYKPLVGVDQMIDAKGYQSFYKFDDLNRLTTILDDQKNILKSFYYHYKIDSVPVVPVTPPPITVYVKMKKGIPHDEYFNDEVKTVTSYWVEYFSDAACTIPHVLDAPLQLRFRETYTVTSNAAPTQVSVYDYYRMMSEGVSSEGFYTSYQYCEGGLILGRMSEAEGEVEEENGTVQRGLPPGQGGTVITCYDSYVTLPNHTGYVVK